jgi:hypothetical protein
MTSESAGETDQPYPESSNDKTASKQVPEVLPPALEGALETAGVDVSNPDVTRAVQVSASFFVARGSLPIMPPEILEEYERRFPGLGRKLIDWTEEQRNHRQSLERLRTERSERRMDRGQFIAGAAALWGLTIAGAAAIYGNPWTAAVIAIVAIGGPTAAIWLARTMNAKDQSPRAPSQPAPPPPAKAPPRVQNQRRRKG